MEIKHNKKKRKDPSYYGVWGTSPTQQTILTVCKYN